MWNLIRFLFVFIAFSSLAHAQLGSWAFNFSSSSPVFFPPQPTNTSCHLAPSSSPFFVLNIPFNTLLQSAVYEIKALSDGPFHFYVAVYTDNFTSEYPCDYFGGYLGNSVRPFGNTAYPVDSFIYLAKQTTYNFIVYVEPSDNNDTIWNQVVMLNIISTTHTGTTNNNTYWDVAYTGDDADPDCSISNTSVPYVAYQWQFSRPDGYYDIYAALDNKQPGLSIGLFDGALPPARLQNNPCSFFLGSNNGGNLGASLYSTYLQQDSFYTIVISNFKSNNAFFGIQIAATNVQYAEYSGFTPANISSLDCIPSTLINDSYWYPYWFRDYFSKEISIFVSASDEWQIFAYNGDNSGINSTQPPETCPVYALLFDYAAPGTSLIINTMAGQLYTFLITSKNNAADVTDPNVYVEVFESIPPTSSTSSTGLTSSTTSRITITTIGNATSDTSSTSSTAGSSTSFSTSFLPSTSDAGLLSVTSFVFVVLLCLIR